MTDTETTQAASDNGVVRSIDEKRGDSAKPVLRISEAEKRRFYTFAERKAELEQQIVAGQLLVTSAALELRDVNEKFGALQQSVAARFGINGVYDVTPDGVVIPRSQPG